MPAGHGRVRGIPYNPPLMPASTPAQSDRFMGLGVVTVLMTLLGWSCVPLFIRHHARGVTLTPVGERVVNEARLLLKQAQDFAQNAIELGDAVKGEITVGCFLTLAIRFMPGLLAGFAQKYPRITVTLREGDQEEMISAMLAG